MPELRAVADGDRADRAVRDPAAEEAAYRNRSLIDACPVPLVAIGADGRITDANGAFLRITGLPHEKVVGSDVGGCFADPDLARAFCQETLIRGLVAESPLAVRHSSGALVHVLCDAAPYRNRQGEIAGVVLAARDVSRQKKRETELARLHAEMTVHAEELARRETEIRRINELYEVLQACNSQEEAYPIIGSAAERLFPGTSGALAVSVNRAHRMELSAQWGCGSRNAALFTPLFSVDECWALRRGQLHQVEGPGALQCCRHFQSPPSGPYACLPLSVRGDLQGLLHLSVEEPLTGQQRELFITLGEVIKLSLSGLKLRDALRAQAIRDPLTGLFNRNYLDETLRRELSRSERRRAPLCVAVLDIDNFKTFNDTYNHHAGDLLLKALADFFVKKLRASDIVCRYGGDEFVLVLPDTGLQQVRKRLDRLRTEVKSVQCRYEDKTLPPASVSIGIAQWPDHGATAEELVKAADRALYSAKHRGRDQVSAVVAGARTR